MKIPPGHKHLPAFSLIELLVTITIIGILAALSFTVAGKVRSRADDVSCLQNLRTIAAAMAAYVGDHGTLPGPTAGGVTPAYTSDTRNLPYYLQKYAGYATPTKTKQYAPPFMCPAAIRKYTLTKMQTMTCMVTVSLPDGTRPFGYPSDSGKGVAEIPPMTPAILSTATDAQGNSGALSSLVVLKEVDQYSEGWKGKPPWGSGSVPTTPLHGNHHNAIFADWHVAPIQPDKAPSK